MNLLEHLGSGIASGVRERQRLNRTRRELSRRIRRIESSDSEPEATQWLACLLGASTGIARAFVHVVSRTGIASFAPGPIEAEERHGRHAPDLTIRDKNEVIRILVENKFWAELTDAQPVAYLDALPDDSPAALLFIVPHQRMYGIWIEMKRRCGRKGISLVNEYSDDAVTWARNGRRTLAITSWKHVLETLERAAAVEGSTLQQDIARLRKVTDRMRDEDCLPLREDEVTDVNIALRLINYSDLAREIVYALQGHDIADKKRLRATCGYYTAGSYLRLHKRFGLWLGVELKAWHAWGITPIWARLDTTSSFSGAEGRIRRVKKLFADAQDADGRLYVPIRLTRGVAGDRVIEDAVQQMHDIADALRSEFSPRFGFRFRAR